MNSTGSESFPKYFSEMFRSGDPYVLDLLFVRNSALPFCVITCYVLLSKYIGPWFMTNKNPFKIQTVVLLYDICSVIANAFVIYKSTKFLPTYGWTALCREAENPEEDKVRLELICVVYSLYALKFVEMLDTAFFVLRKKYDHISNFHVFHHSTAPILVWLTLRSQKRAGMIVYGVVNSLIHIFMYAYYGLSTMGSKFPKLLKWKRYITMLQLIQFFLMVPYFIFLIISDCATPKLPIFIILLHSLFMMAYFLEFYADNYTSSQQLMESALGDQKIFNFAPKNEKGKKL